MKKTERLGLTLTSSAFLYLAKKNARVFAVAVVVVVVKKQKEKKNFVNLFFFSFKWVVK